MFSAKRLFLLTGPGHHNHCKIKLLKYYSQLADHSARMSNTTLLHTKEMGCNLNGHFGIIVQLVLAFTAFSVLIVKRLREPADERRSVMIWFCDTSKQAAGAMFIHFANVFLAMWSKSTDPCTWYFINYLLDTTVGLLVIWFVLKMLHVLASRKNWHKLKMGEYGEPPRFKTWLFQCMAYLAVMLTEKIVILILFQFNFWTGVKKLILKPISGYPKLELVVVLLLVPFVINALMFWVVDNFLMHKRRKCVKTKQFEVDPVSFTQSKKGYGTSDDEAGLHLMSNESNDTLIESGSDGEALHRRHDSTS